MRKSQSLLTSLRALPASAWILFLGSFLNRFGSFVVPFLALYLTRKGYSGEQAGIAIGAYGVGNVGATLLGGFLADHMGRRKTIALSMFSGAAAMLLLSQASDYRLILAVAALAGLTGELYRPASSALLADLVPPEHRVTAYATYRMALNAGFAFGPATAGFIAERGFFWLFAGDAATSVLFGIVAIAALPRITHPIERSGSWPQAIRALVADTRLVRVLLAALGIAMVFSQTISSYGFAVLREGLSAKVYGLLLSLNGATVVLCELPLTTQTRRFHPLSVISFGYLLVGLGFALCAFAHTALGFAAFMTVFTVGEMCSMSVASAFVADRAPAHMRGRFMGSYGMTWNLAQVFGPGLGLTLFLASPGAFWLASGGIGLAAALTVLSARLSPAVNRV